MNYLILPKFLKPRFFSSKIRIGREYDGGYVVSKNAIKKSSILLSLGLYDDWSFEENFLKINKKAKVYIFDGSVSLFFWLKYLLKNLFYFLKKEISFHQLFKNYYQFILFPFFFLRRNIKFIQKNIVGSYINLNNKEVSILDLKHIHKNKNLFIKIDIEGNEYEILDDIIKIKDSIECLVIEFHDLKKNLKKIRKFINKLDLRLIHLHVNNYGKISKTGFPSVVELTFAKKNYCKKKITINLPIKNLDFPNNPFFLDKKIKFKN